MLGACRLTFKNEPRTSSVTIPVGQGPILSLMSRDCRRYPSQSAMWLYISEVFYSVTQYDKGAGDHSPAHTPDGRILDVPHRESSEACHVLRSSMGSRGSARSLAFYPTASDSGSMFQRYGQGVLGSDHEDDAGVDPYS